MDTKTQLKTRRALNAIVLANTAPKDREWMREKLEKETAPLVSAALAEVAAEKAREAAERKRAAQVRRLEQQAEAERAQGVIRLEGPERRRAAQKAREAAERNARRNWEAVAVLMAE